MAANTNTNWGKERDQPEGFRSYAVRTQFRKLGASCIYAGRQHWTQRLNDRRRLHIISPRSKKAGGGSNGSGKGGGINMAIVKDPECTEALNRRQRTAVAEPKERQAAIARNRDYPVMIVPLFVFARAVDQAVDDALPRTDDILATDGSRQEEPTDEDLYSVGTAAVIMRCELHDGRHPNRSRDSRVPNESVASTVSLRRVRCCRKDFSGTALESRAGARYARRWRRTSTSGKNIC